MDRESNAGLGTLGTLLFPSSKLDQGVECWAQTLDKESNTGLGTLDYLLFPRSNIDQRVEYWARHSEISAS